MADCEKYREKISSYIDGMLGETEKQELEEHLKSCRDCARELREIQELVDVCRQMEALEPPDNLTGMIMHSVRKESRKAGFMHGFLKRFNPKIVSVAAVALLLVAVAASGLLSEIGFDMYMGKNASDQSAPAEFSIEGGAEMNRSGDDGAMHEDLQRDSVLESKVKMDRQADYGRMAQAPEVAGTGEVLPAEDERKVIKNAEFTVEVEDFDGVFSTLLNIAGRFGGYVQNSGSYTRVSGTGEYERELKEGHVVLRIPSSKLNTVIDEITGLGEVSYQSLSGNDITTGYMDIQARLNNKEVQEKRLLEVLDRASKIEDILRIEEELNRVRTDIEMYASRLKNWDNLVQYATITVTVKEVEPKDKAVKPPIMGNLWDRIKRAVIVTTNRIIDLVEYAIVGIGYALPVAVILGAGYLVWRTAINKRKGGMDK